jgi:hypothetical protein
MTISVSPALSPKIDLRTIRGVVAELLASLPAK